ncbi:MGMT family protein [Acinetobacter sp. NCu2D-2]|uniref:MGMT family protein n=1 Tax=Acinetobacter sp. NCu2D-2 TaxID=1608473 RepID=UPI001D0D3D9F|nr:methylated-DNA--[protein]-cysteine S-methyltransferase [Acinetobacter sp. NCu2D-2]
MLTATEEMAQMILETVQHIPYGKVASYGQIACLAGLPRHARLVGKTLSQLETESSIPWHRVINASGKITHTRANEWGDNIQALKLKDEGILVVNLKVNLKQFLWDGYAV